MKAIEITTSKHRYIVYGKDMSQLTWINQPILKYKTLAPQWDWIIRQCQKWLTPKRILKYEYIHLLEIIGSGKNLYPQLNQLLTEKHSRSFRYDLCHFIHQLEQGKSLPEAFSHSFDHISDYVLLLKNPHIAKELSELMPFIIHGIDQQIGSQVKLSGLMMTGIGAISMFCSSAYVLANSTFMRMEYHHQFQYLTMHPIASAFQNTFKHFSPDRLIQYLIFLGCIYIIFLVGNQWRFFQKMIDPLVLRLPFYGKLIQFRTAQRMLFTLKLAQSCRLDFKHTQSLLEEQINHPLMQQKWHDIQNNPAYQFELDQAFNQFLEPLGIKLSSLTQPHIEMTFHLVTQEVKRRQRNTELALFTFFMTIITTLLLWLALTWAALERILLIFQ